MSEQDQSAVFAVESPIGLINIVIDGVDRGSAWIDGEVVVNRIPHQVRGVDWNKNWDGKIRAGSRYSIRRTDTSYPEDTTWNAYKKITDAIEAVVAQVMEAEGLNFQHLGRLAELRSAKNIHESEAKRLRSQAEDYLKKATLEEQAVEKLEAALYYLNDESLESRQAAVQANYKRGQRDAQRDIANTETAPDVGEPSLIYDLEQIKEKRLRELERDTPVAHITAYGEVAYLNGYIKTCSDAREALRQAENERYIAERQAQTAAR